MGIKDIVEELKTIAIELERLCQQERCDLEKGISLIQRSRELRHILQENDYAK